MACVGDLMMMSLPIQSFIFVTTWCFNLLGLLYTTTVSIYTVFDLECGEMCQVVHRGLGKVAFFASAVE
jgi:hypothetical protein